MSEQREVSGEFVGTMLILAIVVLCIFITYNGSQIRDLQRRVGTLEQQVKQ